MAHRAVIYSQVRLKNHFTHRHTATARLLAEQGMSVSPNGFCLIVSAPGLIGGDLRMINLFPHWLGMAWTLRRPPALNNQTNPFFSTILTRLRTPDSGPPDTVSQTHFPFSSYPGLFGPCVYLIAVWKEKQERHSRLMMPYKVCKLPVLCVELNNAYPVLDFLQKHMVSVEEGALHQRQINSKLNRMWLNQTVTF